MISAELSKASKNIPDKVYNIGSLDNITEMINSVMLSSFTGRSTSLQCMEGGYFRNIPFKRFMKLNKYGVVCS